jgi:hypothetical protein
MKKLIILCAAFLCGCVAAPKKQVIEVSQLEKMHDQSVTYTTRKMPELISFNVITKGTGAIGVAIALSAGESIISKYSVTDPTIEISENLIKALGQEKNMHYNGQPVFTKSDDVNEISNLANKSRYVIDTTTTSWIVEPALGMLMKYHIIYNVKSRLIDTKNKTVLASRLLHPTPPSYDELFNGGVLFKKDIAQAVNSCVRVFEIEMLSIKDSTNNTLVNNSMNNTIIHSKGQNKEILPIKAEYSKWKALMHCSESFTPTLSNAAYSAPFTMDMIGDTFTLNHIADNVTEKFNGKIQGNSLEITGKAIRTVEPKRSWNYTFRGDYKTGAEILYASGVMKVNGKDIRKCDLKMNKEETIKE